MSIAIIVLARLVEAGFHALIPLSIRFFIDSALPARNIYPLYLMVGVLATGVGIAIATGRLRDLLSVRVHSRSLAGLRQSVFNRELKIFSIVFRKILLPSRIPWSWPYRGACCP